MFEKVSSMIIVTRNEEGSDIFIADFIVGLDIDKIKNAIINILIINNRILIIFIFFIDLLLR
tara:strand:- start:45 stop:230 length:186 start_codon:yes stop_codon:yes gene_type:complete